MLKEDSCSNLTAQQKIIDHVRKLLPKCRSCAQKKKAQQITFLTMAGKITLPQFRVLYQELTGDESVANNKLCKEEDEHMQLILKTADKTIIQDLRMNNGGHIK